MMLKKITNLKKNRFLKLQTYRTPTTILQNSKRLSQTYNNIFKHAFEQKAMISKPIFYFSEEPIKGFEKFKRKNQGQQTQSQKNDQKLEENKMKDENVMKKDEEISAKKESTTEKQQTSDQESKKAENEKQTSEQEIKQEKHSNRHKQKRENQEEPEEEESISYSMILMIGGTALVIAYYLNGEQEISYQDFQRNYLERNLIKKIQIRSDESTLTTGSQIIAIIFLKDNHKRYYLLLSNPNNFLENLEIFQVQKGVTAENFIPIEFVPGKDFKKTVQVFSNFIFYGFFFYLVYMSFQNFRKMGGKDIFGGKKHFKQYGFEHQVKIKFQDVAGLEQAKTEITEFVDFLRQPKKYSNLGAKIPRGALLTGPPGTGKTMLAKACAGEAGVPFFYVSGSDFVEMYVGVGASRVRELFQEAKSKAPSIIFIDEIDAVGKKRKEAGRGGNDERDNTLNQLLVEMDGFGSNQNVVVLAATNMKDLLDPALTRPGRFDRQIEITLPDIEGRKDIFLVHLKPLKLNEEARSREDYAKRLATLTPGFSGADIANLCNEAAILAARQGKKFVEPLDFELASERVMGGLEKKSSLSIEDRRKIAFHECGHAVVSWFLEGGHPLLKLTIIPRSKGSLGYAQYLPNESTLQTKEELLDQICCILGGRCAEEHFYGDVTTGAYDDLKKGQKIAFAIVTQLGMNDKVGYQGLKQGDYSQTYSEETMNIIDQEVHLILQQCGQRTRQLIKQKEDDIKKLAETLLQKETLDLNQLIDILGERPIQPKSNYKAYLDVQRNIKKNLELQ